MIKSNVAAGAVLAAAVFGASAQAADLPSRKVPPVDVPPPAFTWSGFYIGQNSGFGGGYFQAEAGLFGAGLVTGARLDDRASGSVFGGQIGFAHQYANNIVVGLESDFQWTDIKASHQAASNSTLGLAGVTYSDIHQGLNWFGTTRGRLGYSFGRFLPYVTGGVAYGEVEASGLQIVGGAGAIAGSRTDWRVGWSVGAGAEIALSSHLSTRAEYLYLDLPAVSGPASGVSALGPLVGGFRTASLGAHIFRAGANWRFGNVGELAGLFDGPGLLALLLAPPSVKWSGFYAGVNGGYGGDTQTAVVTFAAPGFLGQTRTTNKIGGFLGGGQLGYNYRLSNRWVVGLETDFQWSDLGAYHRSDVFPGPAITQISDRLNWFGTTRARLGFASGATLTYVTGGVAYGDIQTRGSQLAGGVFAGQRSETKLGWAAGAGTEYALNDHLSLNAEYLYLNFDEVRGPAVGLPGPFVGEFRTGTFGAHVTRFGLNWRIAPDAPGPVLAKY